MRFEFATRGEIFEGGEIVSNPFFTKIELLIKGKKGKIDLSVLLNEIENGQGFEINRNRVGNFVISTRDILLKRDKFSFEPCISKDPPIINYEE